MAYISAAMTCVWQVRSESESGGGGLEFVSDVDQCLLFRLFSRGDERGKEEDSTGDEGLIYKQREDTGKEKKNTTIKGCAEQKDIFPSPGV